MQTLTHRNYYDALKRAVRANKHRSNNKMEQLAFCHLIVKAAALYPKTNDTKKMKERRDMMQHAVLFIGKLTFEELLQLFPTDKVYNGAKTGQHDYFDTTEAVKAYQAANQLRNTDPLGDQCLALLSHYRNQHIRILMDELTLLLLHTKSDFLTPFFKVAMQEQQPPQKTKKKPQIKDTRLRNQLSAARLAKLKSV